MQEGNLSRHIGSHYFNLFRSIIGDAVELNAGIPICIKVCLERANFLETRATPCGVANNDAAVAEQRVECGGFPYSVDYANAGGVNFRGSPITPKVEHRNGCQYNQKGVVSFH
jgi:hypothetical protein